MPLEPKERQLFIRIFAGAIIVINMILAAAMFRYYVLNHEVRGIEFVNTTFLAQALGVFYAFIKGFNDDGGPGGPPITIVTPPRYPPTNAKEDERTKDQGISHLNAGCERTRKRAQRDKELLEAERLFRSIPPNSPVYPAAVFNLVATYRELRRYDDATRCLDEVERRFDEFFPAIPPDQRADRQCDLKFARGLVHHRMKDYKRAKELYEEAWHTSQHSYNAPFNLNQLCLETKDPREAAIWYAVLSRFPNFESEIKPRLPLKQK